MKNNPQPRQPEAAGRVADATAAVAAASIERKTSEPTDHNKIINKTET